MNRRSLFRAALAGAVVGLTRHLPMPKAPAVVEEEMRFQGIPVRCDGPLTATEVAMRNEEEVRELMDRMDEALGKVMFYGDTGVFYVSREAYDGLRKLAQKHGRVGR